MLRVRTVLALWGVLFSSVSGGVCGLTFEKPAKDYDARPDDDEVVAEFAFTNTSKTKVTVRDIDSSCGCLSAVTDKETYKPGEPGKLTAIFTVGSFTGYHSKRITVLTDDKTASQIVLTVGVRIPEVIRVEPQIHEWLIDEKPEARTYRIVVEHEDPIAIKSISSTRPGFDFELKTVKEGREYEIVLTPASTGKTLLGALKIETDCAIPKHRRKMVFFSVTRKKRSTPAAQPAKS